MCLLFYGKKKNHLLKFDKWYLSTDSEGRIILYEFLTCYSPLNGQFPITFESISLGTKVSHDFFFFFYIKEMTQC